MKKAVSKKKIWLIVGGVLLIGVLVALWWYGAFADIGKTAGKYDLIPMSSTDTFATDAANLDKQIPRMSTQALADTLCDYENTSVDNPYLYPQSQLETLSQSDRITSMIIAELKHRNNAGRVLLQTYQKAPVTVNEADYFDYVEDKETGNIGGLAALEILLAQEEFQKHLTPWEKAEIAEVTNQKQAEKFAAEAYQKHLTIYNYLYTDAYDENGWNEEKLNEYASKYIDLAE